MIFASSNFGAGYLKDSRDQKLKKNLCVLYLSLREKPMGTHGRTIHRPAAWSAPVSAQ